MLIRIICNGEMVVNIYYWKRKEKMRTDSDNDTNNITF